MMKWPFSRVEKNKGYTVMSNHHLRNDELTLKAKGLLSQMLSLTGEIGNYTLKGLALINREQIDAIREGRPGAWNAPGTSCVPVSATAKAGCAVQTISFTSNRKNSSQPPPRLYWIYLRWKIQCWIIQRRKSLHWKTLRRKNQRN